MKRIGMFIWLLITLAMFFPSSSFSNDGITLLMVPREDGLVHLGKDVGTRHPTLLISYALLANGTVSLHGWSGSEWVNVTPESFAEGSFFHKQPESAVIVWEADAQMPEALIPSGEWCPMAYGISTTEMRALIHLLGRHYEFRYDDWKWFSENYKMPLESINPDNLNVSWYHRRLGENLKQSPTSGESDLEYYAVLSGSAAVPVNELDPPAAGPVDAESEADAEACAEGKNPLTNAVPQATVLGAGEADEAESAEEGADEPDAEAETQGQNE
jgi:hypothetical protein